MEKMIAFCGLNCTQCPAFLATQKDDNAERKRIAKLWSTENEALNSEDINCDGCLTVGKRLIKFCNICEVRHCGSEKNVENCAHCDEYVCGKLDKLWGILESPGAKATLEEIRKTRFM